MHVLNGKTSLQGFLGQFQKLFSFAALFSPRELEACQRLERLSSPYLFSGHLEDHQKQLLDAFCASFSISG